MVRSAGVNRGRDLRVATGQRMSGQVAFSVQTAWCAFRLLPGVQVAGCPDRALVGTRVHLTGSECDSAGPRHCARGERVRNSGSHRHGPTSAGKRVVRQSARRRPAKKAGRTGWFPGVMRAPGRRTRQKLLQNNGLERPRGLCLPVVARGILLPGKFRGFVLFQ